MMSNGKRFRWITLLTLFMTVRSLRAAKQPRCNMTTGIARTGRFVWRNKHGNCDERLIATEPAFALPFTKRFLQHRNQLDDPAVNGGMIDEQAALLHHLFEIAQTQRVGDVPPDAQQHDVQYRSRLITLLALPISNARFATNHPT